MKHALFSVFLILSIFSQGQNLQLHYDFTDANSKNAEDRNYLTSTFEMFRPDSLGSTFWFIDLDFNGPHNEPNLSYLEIARNFKMWDFPIALHAEYNGGFLYNTDGGKFGNTFSNIGIFGVQSSFRLKNISLSTYVGYKFIDESREGADFQWTFTWFTMLWDNRITLAGFFDLWSQDDLNVNFEPDGKKIVVLTEPQIWYNIFPWWSMGGEVEISHNFVYGSNKLEAFPTLGTKFTF